MTAPLTINGFLGANLAVDETLLADGVGTASLNQRPGYGDLRPWNAPSDPVATVPTSPQRKTIYRMGQDVASNANYWLSWSAVVNVTRGYDTDDTTERTYFTGFGTPKWTDNIMGLGGGPPYPQATRELGVPAPTTPVIAAIHTNPATGTAQAYSWVYTFVNDIGWESAPSPPSNSVLANPLCTFDLSNFDTPPSGSYGIATIRLYRYVPGDATSGGYLFLREWPVGSTPANPVDDARNVGSDVVATTGWRPCPGIPNGGLTNLTEATAVGLVKMWNGMLGVGCGKSFRICEPFYPYAWPLAYEIPLTADFVAAGVWGQRVLILTTGDATVAAGSTPDAMDSEPAKINRPCSSACSVVEFNEGEAYRGVAWASEEGLCWYGDGGFALLTSGVMTREQWQALVPSSMVATRYLGFYLCFYNDGTGLKGFVIDPKSPQGIYFLDTGFVAVARDPLSDQVFVLDGGNVRNWNAGTALMTASFTSKKVQVPAQLNYGAIEVLAKAWPVQVKVWADEVLRCTISIPDQNQYRLPGGYEAERWQVQVSGAVRVIAVRLAVSPDDLRNQ